MNFRLACTQRCGTTLVYMDLIGIAFSMDLRVCGNASKKMPTIALGMPMRPPLMSEGYTEVTLGTTVDVEGGADCAQIGPPLQTHG